MRRVKWVLASIGMLAAVVGGAGLASAADSSGAPAEHGGVAAPSSPSGALKLPASKLPKESRVPGGVVLLPIDGAADDPPTVKLGDSPAMVLRAQDHWLAVVGVPLSTEPGPLKV